MKVLQAILWIALAGIVLSSGVAQAGTITEIDASLYSPISLGGTQIKIDLSSISTPSKATITTTDYTITFYAPDGQGVVRNASSGNYAIPIADASGEYLKDGFGSFTNDASLAKYLSTGTGSIEIKFAAPQSAFALLWGSIDGYNSLSFNDNDNTTIKGDDISKYIGGFHADGSQGPGGSAYVWVNFEDGDTFTTVRAISTQNSFEFAGVTAADSFHTPEPSSLLFLGSGAVGLLGFARRKLFS